MSLEPELIPALGQVLPMGNAVVVQREDQMVRLENAVLRGYGEPLVRQ